MDGFPSLLMKSQTASADGGFLAVWTEYDPKATETTTNSWDIFVRAFNQDLQAKGPQRRVNTFTYGDQLAPKIASGTGQFVVWTSLGQDGSREGVFGQARVTPGDGKETWVNVLVRLLPAPLAAGMRHLVEADREPRVDNGVRTSLP